MSKSFLGCVLAMPPRTTRWIPRVALRISLLNSIAVLEPHLLAPSGRAARGLRTDLYSNINGSKSRKESTDILLALS